jgi:hypothetical protein
MMMLALEHYCSKARGKGLERGDPRLRAILLIPLGQRIEEKRNTEHITRSILRTSCWIPFGFGRSPRIGRTQDNGEYLIY